MAGRLKIARRVRQKKGGKIAVRREFHQPGIRLEGGVERAILVGGAVVIAERREGPYFQCAVRGGSAAQLVLDDSSVFALYHEDRFFDLQAVHFIDEHGERVLAELLQAQVPLWVDRSGIAIAG